MDQLADFEPLEYYEKHLKGAIERNAEEYFDALVKRSGVDPEQNKATVARYNKEAAEAEEAGKKLGSFKALKIFLIVLTVIAFLAAVILIFSYASGECYWLYLFLGILFALLGIGLVVLLCTVIKKKLKEREDRHKKEVEEANAVLKQAYDEMAPLNALFTWDMTRELVLKTMPDLTLDEQLDVRRLDLLCRKYGYEPDGTRAFPPSSSFRARRKEVPSSLSGASAARWARRLTRARSPSIGRRRRRTRKGTSIPNTTPKR